MKDGTRDKLRLAIIVVIAVLVVIIGTSIEKEQPLYGCWVHDFSEINTGYWWMYDGAVWTNDNMRVAYAQCDTVHRTLLLDGHATVMVGMNAGGLPDFDRVFAEEQ